MTPFDQAHDCIQKASRITGFSGAGISTESGIPDFRSPGGVWSTHRTVTYQEFLADESHRIEYWRQKQAMWPQMKRARPNAGHMAFVRLHQQGRLLGMITQNIDGLHRKSGLPLDRIAALHGTTTEVHCLSCGDRISMDEACLRIQKGEQTPRCTLCGGSLKPATVSFGQSMPAAAMDRAHMLSIHCDLFLAAGSSLVVQPAADFPMLAKQNGACLIIINRTETPLDAMADVVLHEEIGPTLSRMVSR